MQSGGRGVRARGKGWTSGLGGVSARSVFVGWRSQIIGSEPDKKSVGAEGGGPWWERKGVGSSGREGPLIGLRVWVMDFGLGRSRG